MRATRSTRRWRRASTAWPSRRPATWCFEGAAQPNGYTEFVLTGAPPPRGEGDGALRTLRQPTGDVFRSVLCFWAGAGGRPRHAAGPAAIEAYLESPLDSRPHHVDEELPGAAQLHRDTHLRPRLGAGGAGRAFLRHWLAPFARGDGGARIVVGRPVRFVGETAADHALGEQRLRAAFAAAGCRTSRSRWNPPRPGIASPRGSTAPATVLVADFGGGTSDFSVLRFEPAAAPRDGPRPCGRGHRGRCLRLPHHRPRRLAAARQGRHLRVMGNPLPVPPAWYAGFARWHQLSLMRAPRTLRDIAEVARTANASRRLHRPAALIEEEAGYALYRAVSGVKAALSRAEDRDARLRHGRFVLHAESRAPSSRPGSRPNSRASAPPWMPRWPMRRSARRRWTASSSPAARRSCRPCGALRRALRRGARGRGRRIRLGRRGPRADGGRTRMTPRMVIRRRIGETDAREDTP
jgi:hypothetical chaperone protein